MNKFRVIGAICVLLGAWFLFAAINPFKASGFTFDFSFSKATVHQGETVSAESVRSIEAHAGSADIDIVRGTSDQIVLNLDGKVNKKRAKSIDLTARTEGDKLIVGIDGQDGVHIGFGWSDLTLTLELPAKTWEALTADTGSGNVTAEGVGGTTVQLKSGSGNVTANGLNCTDAKLDAGSGNIKAADIECGDMKLHTGSGDLKLENVKASAAALSANSGNVKLERYAVGELTVKAGSGDTELNDGEAAVTVQAGSGNIRVEGKRLTGNHELRTGSGNVTIELDERPGSLAVDFSAGSGRSSVSADGFVEEEKDRDGGMLRGRFGDGEVKLKARSGSGNIKLEY